MVNLGGRKIKSMYLGNRKIKKAYLGDVLVYGYSEITASPLSVARHDMASTSIVGMAFFGGGITNNDARSAIVDAYSSNLTLEKPSNLRSARAYLAATSIGGYAMFAGGDTTTTNRYAPYVDVYDTTLTRTAPQSDLSVARQYLAAASAGKYAIFAGGQYRASSGYTYSSSDVDAYDSDLTRITPTSKLSSARTFLYGFGASVGNYAIFAGGGSYSADVDVYDSELTHTIGQDLSVGRSYISSTSVDGYAIFASGQSSSSTYTSAVDAYDKTLVRTIADDFSAARARLSAASANNTAMFGGGFFSGSGTGQILFKTVDSYDSNLVHKIEDDLSVTRYTHSAASVGKYILFAGGMDKLGQAGASTVVTTNTIDVYAVK